jgi:serine/threonine protein kinase
MLEDVIQMSVQIAKGMTYLQEQKVIHRDLTARSILIKDRICIISDFSEAVIDGRPLKKVHRDKKMPIRWTAPESALSKTFTLKSDVWSFGVLLHEMVTNGVIPYSDIKEVTTILNKLRSGYRLPRPEKCPKPLYKLMLHCWSEDPDERPRFQKVHETLERIHGNLAWEIEESHINQGEKLGCGRFGDVWEGKYKEMSVAVKYHKPAKATAEEFMWEAELLKTLDHPNILKLVGLNSNVEKVFVVTTFMKHGTLLMYLKGFGRSQTLRALMTMSAQVADGMAYLQTQSVIHRDLAARSILVGENNVCVISDFSEALCTARQDNPERKGRKFPVKWLPPEAIVGNIFNMQTDVWSFAILLYEIATLGDVPYPGLTHEETLRQVLEGYRMPIPHSCPEDVYTIMTECWRENPTTRPSFETIQLRMNRICNTCRNVPIVRSRALTAVDVRVERKRSYTDASSDIWELEQSSIRLDTKHEEGRFGEVWKGYLYDKDLVAVKIPKTDRTTVSAFLHEAEIMKMLKHPNLVTLRGICTKGEPTYIVTDFMAHGSMVKYLRGAGRRAALPQLLTWASEVCDGMRHLEQCSIIHRDVAARNILLSQELVCKISDFGLAQKVTGDTYKESSRTQFPLKWMAPEAIHQRLFSVKSDVWAFGILLYEMITHGALPYPGVQNRDVAQLVKAGYRMPCPRGCPKEVHEIMCNCWKQTPEERPNFSSIGTALSSLKSKQSHHMYSNTYSVPKSK